MTDLDPILAVVPGNTKRIFTSVNPPALKQPVAELRADPQIYDNLKPSL